MNLQKYLDQLHIDITTATENGVAAVVEDKINMLKESANWKETSSLQPISLEKWCGIQKEQLPPEVSLTESQLAKLLDQLKTLLKTYHISVVFQLLVPKNIQYRIIRARFNQEILYQKDVNKFHFSFCDQPSDREDCLLEEKYCHCNFYDNFFKKYSSQEEDNKSLEIGIDEYKAYLLKRRFGDNWYQYLRINDEDLNKEA